MLIPLFRIKLYKMCSTPIVEVHLTVLNQNKRLVGKLIFRHSGKLRDFINLSHGESTVCCKYQEIKLQGSLRYTSQYFICKPRLLNIIISFPRTKLLCFFLLRIVMSSRISSSLYFNFICWAWIQEKQWLGTSV